MEITERLPLKKLHYLNTWTFKQYKQYANSSCKNDEERKVQFNILKRFCANHIKAKGEIIRLYSYTENTPIEVGGRLFCAYSIQGLSKSVRGFLMKHTTDIDMKNAHPTILKYLCHENDIQCPNLEYYINNRDEVVRNIPDGKNVFLSSLNNDKLNNKIQNKFFKDFDKEMKHIQKQIYELPCYNHIVKTVPTNKAYNWMGSGINRIMCVYENKILQSVLSVINHKSIEIGALMFDGTMPYGNYYDDAQLLVEIEAKVDEDFPNLNMKFSYKEHNNDIVMPEDFEIPEKIVVEKMQTFEKVSNEFEENHCKIVNKSIFIKELKDDIIVMSKPQIKASYENIVYEQIKDTVLGEAIQECNFIDDWLRNNKKQRCYEDIGIYPTGLDCPKTHFNLWRNFAMESVTEYTPKKEESNILLHHIKILCNHEEEVYNYVICWIAQMIQYPAVKSICVALISKEGAGKGTLLDLLGKMLGEKKILETSNPTRDVWGDFNGQMSQAFLVNLNELSKKETQDAEGKIKTLITDPRLTINNKGVNQFPIVSYHRFLVTTNNEEPMNSKKDDRRNLICRSSDEKIGDVEYFTKLRELIEDQDVVKTCYEYFKSIPDMDKFKSIPIPKTEYQNNLKELSVSPIELWLKHFTLQNIDKEEVEMLGVKTLEKFNYFCANNGIEYNVSSQKLGVRLSNMKLEGIKKGNHTRQGETKIFDIKFLKEHFQLGCLIAMDNNESENESDDE
jgi:hypothetical protein